MEKSSVGFPFGIDHRGRVAVSSGEDNIRARIAQALLTAPGERVQLPEFGCGLRDLVFDPGNEILAATCEFTVAKALQAWVGDAVIVERIELTSRGGDQQASGTVGVEVAYILRGGLQRQRIRVEL